MTKKDKKLAKQIKEKLAELTLKIRYVRDDIEYIEDDELREVLTERGIDLQRANSHLGMVFVSEEYKEIQEVERARATRE